MKMDNENQPPPSVIEALMGLNTHPVQKRRRKRVLSENYLQKTSSLHFSHKSLPSRTCSSATAMQVDVTDLVVPTMSFVDQFCNADYQICRSDSVFRSSLWDSQDTSLHPRQQRVLKLKICPNIENRLETKLSLDAMKFQQKIKRIPLKPSKGRFSKKYKVTEQDLTSENLTNKLDAPNVSDSSVRFISGNMIWKEENLRSHVPSKGNWIMTHRSLIRPRNHWDTNWHLVIEEANKSTPDTGLHITESNGSLAPCNSRLVSKNLDSSPSMMSVSPSNKSKIGRCDQNESDGSNGVYELLHDSGSCLEFCRLKDCETGLADQIIATQYATEIDPLICDSDGICQEASQSLSEDTLASSQTPEPLSPTRSESDEVSRCSPISVLESISKGGVPSTMDCFMNGSIGLYEVYSEGLGMTVSSDEDNREESADTIEEYAELSDRSYLVSVLGEACRFGDINYGKWCSFENPMSPLVFQILEVKYERHVSWPKSERKLLFDRINLGLTDTAKSFFSIRQISASLRQRCFPCWTRKEVEENLWTLLVTQNKEAPKTNDIRPFKTKNSTSKKGKKSNSHTCNHIKVSEGDFSFSEFEDYMDEVIIDIEKSLLDELVSECL